MIDSTGIKTLGDDEWHSLKHKPANRRRSWRKQHLAADGEGFIVGSALTDSGADDATVGAARNEVLAGVAGERGTTIVVPPRKTASPSKPAEALLAQRDAAIGRIAEVGRRQWRKESGAHQQAEAENAMLRYKRIIGDSLRAKKPAAQVRETTIGMSALSRVTVLGRPESVKIVA